MALIENLSNDDAGSENVATKINMRPFKLSASIWIHLMFQM